MKLPVPFRAPLPRPRPLLPARTLLLSVPLLLAGCRSGPDAALHDQTLTLGQGASVSAQQSFSGSWSIEGLPAWLSASTARGSGDLKVTFSANRAAGAPTAANTPSLLAAPQVRWTSADGGTTGTATLNVSADLYTLRGTVTDQASTLAAADVDRAPSRPPLTERALPGPRGVIVAYRSQAARVQAMRQEREVRSAVGETLTLRTDDVPGTLARLRADTDVLYAVPDAVLTALDRPEPTPSIPVRTASAQALAAPQQGTDEFAPLQWAYRLLGYPAVWRDMTDHPYPNAVTVAVLDTGVRYDHPDLQGQLYGPGDGALDVLPVTRDPQTGKLTYDNGDGDGPDTDPTDPDTFTYSLSDPAHQFPIPRSDPSHGTHVTGIIAARWGTFAAPCADCSTSGVVGASYRAPVRVLPVRVLDAPDGNGQESDIALALRYAAGDPVTLSDGRTYRTPHPAQVINLSLGGPLRDPDQIQVLCSAVSRATALGALVVAAGGNFGGTAPIYPAACPGAVSVASVSLSDSAVPTHAYYSDQYAQVALSAPGGNPATTFNGGTLNGQPMPDEILSTGWNYASHRPGYYLEAGTSQAAPQVTALAALLLSKGVAATPAAALDRMLATATDLGAAGRDSTYGVGLIQPAAALGALAVSDVLGLSVQDASGRTFTPALDGVGRFTAYLPDGAFRVVAGRDRNGNGLAGETGEPRVEKAVTLGPSLPTFDVGTLTPTP
ncbi:S8 family serine peptidase [Deinococcus aquiradiocola]|uniref:Serine protease n=1 Tax=Deinococcus aquiradiocola TaxID=393059 RepID=A0A917PSJ1_9DEIO|nr:S8 family serine peptidase [Deinococcus aquiradiocola]GGJ90079.1 serine protease [Deinococcus aquiradiocola]